MVANAPPSSLPRIRARVDKLLVEQGRTTKWLYEAIGMSKTGFRDMWTDATVRVTTLESIAMALRTTVCDLVGDEPLPSTAAEPAPTYARSRYVEQRVDDLERQVRELQRALARKLSPA